MHGLLRRNDIGQDPSVAVEDGGGSFITGGFNAEDGAENCRRGSSIHTGDKRSVSGITRDSGGRDDIEEARQTTGKIKQTRDCLERSEFTNWFRCEKAEPPDPVEDRGGCRVDDRMSSTNRSYCDSMRLGYTPAMASCSMKAGAPSRRTTLIFRLSLKWPLMSSSDSGSPIAR